MRSGHGAPVFTGDLLTFRSRNCELAVPLRHVRGFPTLGLLRGLRPVVGPSADGVPCRYRPGWPAGRRPHNGSHVHHQPVDGIGAQLFPCSPRHGYAAVLHRDPRTDLRDVDNGVGQLTLEATDALHYRPRSTRFEPVPDLRGFHHWFLHSYTSPSCLPDPSRLAVPARPVVVEAAPTPPCASRARLPPASMACCDRPQVGPFTPPGCLAPRGAPRSSGRPSALGVAADPCISRARRRPCGTARGSGASGSDRTARSPTARSIIAPRYVGVPSASADVLDPPIADRTEVRWQVQVSRLARPQPERPLPATHVQCRPTPHHDQVRHTKATGRTRPHGRGSPCKSG